MGLRMDYSWTASCEDRSHAGTGNISVPSPLEIDDATEQVLKVLREQWPGYRVKITPISVAAEEEKGPSNWATLLTLAAMILVAGLVAAGISMAITGALR